MKNNRVQLLLNYEKENYGSCTGLVVSDKTIIVMFFLISFVKHVIPGNSFWYQGHNLNKVGRCPIPNIKTLGIEDASMFSEYKPVKSLLRPFLYFTTNRYAWKFNFLANLVIYFDFSCFPYIIMWPAV